MFRAVVELAQAIVLFLVSLDQGVELPSPFPSLLPLAVVTAAMFVALR